MRNTFLDLLLATSLLLASLVVGQVSGEITRKEREIAEAITASQLSSYLHFIASDALGGRDTPSQGLDVAAEFLEMNVEKWGFKPAGHNGSFFQKIALTRESLDPAQTTLEIGGQNYAFGDDFFRVSGTGTVSGPV